MADRVTHGKVEKPCVKVSADDQMSFRRQLCEIAQQGEKLLCFRKLGLNQSDAHVICQASIRMDHVRLDISLDLQAAAHVLVQLIAEPCLPASRHTCMLTGKVSRIEQWPQHLDRHMLQDLMRYRQERYISDLTSHAVGPPPN